MKIIVNGEERDVPEGLTVRGLLEHLGIDPSRVAVELDLEILNKGQWSVTALHPGARLEIVHFVGGG